MKRILKNKDIGQQRWFRIIGVINLNDMFKKQYLIKIINIINSYLWNQNMDKQLTSVFSDYESLDNNSINSRQL